MRVSNSIHIKSATLIPSPSTASSSPSPPAVPSSSSSPLPPLCLSLTFDLTVPCHLSLYPCATEFIDRSLPDQLPTFSSHPDCHPHQSSLPAGLSQTIVLPLTTLYPPAVLSQLVAPAASRPPGPSLFSFSSSRHYYPLIVHCERRPSPPSPAKDAEESKAHTPHPSVDHCIGYFILSRPRAPFLSCFLTSALLEWRHGVTRCSTFSRVAERWG